MIELRHLAARLRAEADLLDRLATELEHAAPAAPAPDPSGDRLLTAAELAGRLQLTRKAVYARAARWPFTRRLSKSTIRFSEAGLDQWLAGRRLTGR